MDPRSLRATALVALVTLAFSGCSNLSPGENAGIFGAVGGIAAGGIARAAGMNTAGAVATGIAAGAIIGATVYVITKRQATERQRQIAQQRARRAYRAMPPERKTAMKKKKVRYIAVDTPKDERTSPKAETNVMLWDTEAEEIVGNDVYDVQAAPAIGTTARFETYSAEYVGTGS